MSAKQGTLVLNLVSLEIIEEAVRGSFAIPQARTTDAWTDEIMAIVREHGIPIEDATSIATDDELADLESRLEGHLNIAIERGKTITMLRRQTREYKEGAGQWRNLAKRLARRLHEVERMIDSEETQLLVEASKPWADRPGRLW